LTSRLRAAGCLLFEIVNEKETDHGDVSRPDLEGGIPMTQVAVIYYSATGNVHALAEAVAEGAAEAGAQVRLRRVAELAPAEAIDSNPAWRAHVDATAEIQVATTAD
jgi:sulfite reductase alpha subunit-like flavoprotein